MDIHQALQSSVVSSRRLLIATSKALLEGANADAVAGVGLVSVLLGAANFLQGPLRQRGADACAEFMRCIDQVLDGIDEGDIVLDTRLASLLRGCAHHVGDMALEAEQHNLDEGAELATDCRHLLARLQAALAWLPAEPLSSGFPNMAATAAAPVAISVDANKLDRLIALVGELVTTTANAQHSAQETQRTELQQSHAALSALVGQVRDATLQMRMVTLGAAFRNIKAWAHDLACELGKSMVLEVDGEDTELDKIVIERLSGPLASLLRNAIEHGIEPPVVRRAMGKPEQGTVRLSARHEAGHLVIEVSDDGSGFRTQRVLAQAIERGATEAGRTLSDAQIHALAFEPAKGTNKDKDKGGDHNRHRSGGLPVLRSAVGALRGTLSVCSQQGAGATVGVRLPLALSIIEGFQVAVGNLVFVLPLDSVDECLAHTDDADCDLTELRGESLPVLRLRSLFEVPGPRSPRSTLVVVQHNGRKAGLLVDALLGKSQTVIKPLSRLFDQVRGISGSAILGNGEVALILDVAAVMNQATAATSPLSLDPEGAGGR
ncbi:MAG: chemotaxis protein CheW [Pseudomonadota bacterium]